LESLRPLFGPTLGPNLRLHSLDRGRDGFRSACSLQFADLPLGRVDFGGDSQRGWVRWNITGTGCQWIESQGDWQAIEEVERLPEAEIRRADLALTTWERQVTHERVVEAHGAGHFTTRGRPPDLQTITGSNPRAGRTCYVGKRTSEKFFRGYEKGFELAGKLGALGQTMTHIDGHPIEDIYRCEVELKPEGGPVPWEVIERRDQYFAGCYPFLGDLLPGVQGDILMRRPERVPQLELKAALANCKRQFGASLFTALAAYQGDIFRVWDQIIGDTHNADLLAAGVLVVDHE